MTCVLCTNFQNLCSTVQYQYNSQHCSIVVYNIVYLLENKNIECKLIKVKGYLGIVKNKEANKVAKKDLEEGLSLELNNYQAFSMQYKITWNGLIVDRI